MTTAAPAAIPELQLPELSGASAAVRDQLTERFARVSLLRERGAAGADLASAYGDVGVLLLAAGYYDAAETALLHARALAAQDARWSYYLGHVYRLRNEPDRSVEAFETARRIQPADVPTLVRLAEAQLSAGRPEAADATLTEASRLAPGQPRILATRGRTALARRDYAAAITSFEEALRVEPAATAVHYQLSLAYRGAGDAAKADAELGRRGTTEPSIRDPLMDALASLDSASMYDNRSRDALTRGDWATAISEARRGLALAGTSPNVLAALHHRIGTALAQTGDTAGAEREFKASVAAAPEMPRAHYSLGVLRLSSGQTDAALREFSLALQGDSTYVAARVTRADVLRRNGRAGEALSEYERALELDPMLAAAQFGAGLALARLGRCADARDRLMQATADHPGDRALTVALAQVLAACPNAAVRDPDRAMALLEPVLRTAATLEAVEAMARALAELGRFEQAAEVQRQGADRARETGERALADSMAETARLYQQRRVPRWLWRVEPLYEPTS